MYKKISKIIIACMSFSIALCMQEQEEDIFKKAIQKGIIPILAVNNFVIPRSSAYRILQKEAALPYECLEKFQYMARSTIQAKNDRIKSVQENKYGPAHVYTIPFIKDMRDILHPSGSSVSRYIEIIYARKQDGIEVCLGGALFVYRAKDCTFKAKKYSEKRYPIMNLPLAMMPYLPQNVATCFLLYSGDKYLLDRILIKNMCNMVSSSVAEKALVVWQSPVAPQEQLINKIISSAHRPSQELAVGEPLSFMHDIHILNDDIEEDDCLPVCRRIISIVGFLLFIYLYA